MWNSRSFPPVLLMIFLPYPILSELGNMTLWKSQLSHSLYLDLWNKKLKYLLTYILFFLCSNCVCTKKSRRKWHSLVELHKENLSSKNCFFIFYNSIFVNGLQNIVYFFIFGCPGTTSTFAFQKSITDMTPIEFWVALTGRVLCLLVLT